MIFGLGTDLWTLDDMHINIVLIVSCTGYAHNSLFVWVLSDLADLDPNLSFSTSPSSPMSSSLLLPRSRFFSYTSGFSRIVSSASIFSY